MTNIGHAHAAEKLLDQASSVDSRFWICPPTRMNANTLMQEGD
jgi:aconitate hydratase 2/2-methylisocitrate dehydratase